MQMVGGARLSVEQRDVILAVRDAFLRSVGALMARRRQLVSTIQVRLGDCGRTCLRKALSVRPAARHVPI
jgi:hypothetical protein